MSTNSSGAISVYSDVSSTTYTEHIQALANSSTWANQVKISESKKPTLSYVIPKIGETNNANKITAIEIMLEPHGINNNNICSSKSLDPSTTLYSINQPINLQL